MLQMTDRNQKLVGRAKSSSISLRLTISVAISGLVVFATTGFLGYCGRGEHICPATLDIAHGPVAFIDSVFIKPWPLFLWLCALVFSLEQSMLSGLRDVKPEVEKAWRRRMYVVTAASIVVVGIFDLYRHEIGDAITAVIRQLGQQGLLFRLVSSPWFYTVVNFGIILVLAGGAVRRWIRFHNEQADERALTTQLHRAAVQFPDTLDADGPKRMAMHELVIGDVLVRSALVLALSFTMRAEFIGMFVPHPDPNSQLPHFDSCSVSLPGRCTTHLSFLDLILALLGLVGSVALAAVFAQAIVRQRVQEREDAAGASHAGDVSLAEERVVRLPVRNAPKIPLDQIGRDVALQLLKTLARPFQRVDATAQDVGNPYDPLAILSAVVWPLLVLGGVFSAATMARATQHSLHHTLWDLFPVQRFEGFPSDPNMYELLGIVAGCLALVAIIVAARIMTRKPEALAKGLEFIRDNGFMTLVLFCVYAFALWLVEELLVQLAGPVHPVSLRLSAFSFGLVTIGSFFLLLWFAVAVLARRGRSRSKSAPQPPGI